MAFKIKVGEGLQSIHLIHHTINIKLIVVPKQKHQFHPQKITIDILAQFPSNTLSELLPFCTTQNNFSIEIFIRRILFLINLTF